MNSIFTPRLVDQRSAPAELTFDAGFAIHEMSLGEQTTVHERVILVDLLTHGASWEEAEAVAFFAPQYWEYASA